MEVVDMPKKNIQLAPMHRIIKKAGAERVSESAARELRIILEEVGLNISKEALDFMKHAGRKTVKGVDISIAAKKILK
jgi:histone H3/H4